MSKFYLEFLNLYVFSVIIFIPTFLKTNYALAAECGEEALLLSGGTEKPI